MIIMMVVIMMIMMVIMMMSVMIMIVTMKIEMIKWGMRILLMPKGDVGGRVRYSEDVIMYVTANGDHYGLIMMAVMTWPI